MSTASKKTGIILTVLLAVFFLIGPTAASAQVDLQSNCFTADQFYTSPESGLAKVDLGGVIFYEAKFKDGTSAGLGIGDCMKSDSSVLEVQVGWSEETAQQQAYFQFTSTTCGGKAPTKVSVTLSHGSSCLLEGYDDSGNFVAKAEAAADSSVQTLTLSATDGIRKVVITGAEICIGKICVECGDTGDPGDTQDDCAVPGDYYDAETVDLQYVNMGYVAIYPSVTMPGMLNTMQVRDCDNDGELEVPVPYSPEGVTQYAYILMSTNLCQGSAPQKVEVYLTHGLSCKLVAYDDNGNQVASATAAGGSAPQVLTLSSSAGIRKIDIIGQEICIDKVCWYCDDGGSGPDPGDPDDDNCAEPSEYYTSPASGLSSVNLGMVTIQAATAAAFVPTLDVTDCDGDKALEVMVNWSDEGAMTYAHISMSPTICDGSAPAKVEIYATLGADTKFVAYDDNGNVVDSVNASYSASQQVITLASSDGVRTIDIIGSETCIDKICWYCDDGGTGPDPNDDNCAEPSEYYSTETTGLSSVNMGYVSITAAQAATFVPSLDVTDCDKDGALEVSVGWSEETASKFAQVVMSPNVCQGQAPKKVEIYLTIGSDTVFKAYDDNGNMVASTTKSSGSSPVVVTLSAAAGIRTIDMIGAELCIDKVCWYCDADPGGDDNCVEPKQYYDSEKEGLASVNLGAVTISAAVSPAGDHSLKVSDCDSDGDMDVYVPWSGDTATTKAMILLSNNLCLGKAPQKVEVYLTQYQSCQLDAYDNNGNLVDTETSAGGGTAEVITLSSAQGIRSIYITGSEICISKICWYCDGGDPGDPGDDTCVVPGQFYTAAVEDAATVSLGPITMTAAVQTDGTISYLDVMDCDKDGDLDVSVGWSEDSAQEKALIKFTQLMCPNGDPQKVEVYLTHGFSCKLVAYSSAGTMVDSTEVASGSAQVATLTSSDGISFIAIVGAEICISKICWYCDGGGTGPDPTTGNCVLPGDYYTSYAQGMSQVVLGPVTLNQAVYASGQGAGLDISDCNKDDLMDVYVPNSEGSGTTYANIVMGSTLCDGNAPTLVEVYLTHFNSCTLVALDASNTVVDTVTAASGSTQQVLSLSSSSGIRTIQIKGSEICIHKICWDCTDYVTPEENFYCAEAGEFYDAPASNLSEVTLGSISIKQAVSAAGTHPLSIQDCNSDNKLDVYVPWSGTGACPKAAVFFGPKVCGGTAPKFVQVFLTNGESCTLNALDDSGTVVATVEADSDPGMQTLELSSDNGIRKIEIVGSEVCISRICWSCRTVVYIPHITGGDSKWLDILEIDNPSQQAATYTVTLYQPDGTPVAKTYTINGLGYDYIDLKSAIDSTATCGRVDYFSPGLNFRIAYANLEGGGVAEFNLYDTTAEDLGCYFANYSDIVEWKGIAVMNTSETVVNATLIAVGDGTVLGTADILIPPLGKIAGYHTRWFPDLGLDQVYSIMLDSDYGPLLGISISGTNANDKLLFTPAFPNPGFVY